jgi:acid phosphatase
MLRFCVLILCLPLWLSSQNALNRDHCVPASGNHENLNAILWVRTSLEYRHSAVQAYRLASRLLLDALADKTWTAAVEQSTGYESLPPAVILDVDETVLDNSPAQTQTMERGNGLYTDQGWDEWVRKAEARGVPGALEFLRLAAAKGVEIFYVTNRERNHEESTIQNLAAMGFPSADALHVMTKGEVPGWNSDKTSRRRYVASRYRVVLLIGDDANDFLGGLRGSIAERDAAIASYESYLGTRWIMLPNPTYGSWENAIWGGGYAKSREQGLADKCKALP